MAVKITVLKSTNRIHQLKLELDRAMATEMRAVAKDIQKDFESTASTFQNKPTFSTQVEVSSSKIVIRSGTSDPVWNYLDKGTSVRHAVMSRDWVSKTKPSTGGGAVVNLTPGPGRGRRVFVSRRINRPGIKARRFTTAIRGMYERSLPNRLQGVINKAAAKYGPSH